MEELLVLGQIPFTNIRISFGAWLLAVAALIVTAAVFHLVYEKSAAIRAYILNQKVSRLLAHHHLL